MDVEAVTWKQIAFDSIFNYYNVLLLIIAVISVGLPDREWPLFTIIMIVVPLSAFINFLQELRSTAARSGEADILPNIYVRRQTVDGDSKEAEVDRKDIVCGDVLFVSAGDVIAADCIVLASSNLSVSQSR